MRRSIQRSVVQGFVKEDCESGIGTAYCEQNKAGMGWGSGQVCDDFRIATNNRPQ